MQPFKTLVQKFVKAVMPPVLYQPLQDLKNRKTYRPVWTTLSYPPLEGVHVFLDPSGAWQKKMVDGSYDQFLFDRLKGKNLTGKVIYDIGAHIGYHSLYFARLVGAGGKVHAFEPSPVNAKRFNAILEKNPEIRKIVSVHQNAVSDIHETLSFTLNNDIESGRSSGNFIEKADTFSERSVYTVKGFVETKVEAVPMDSFKKILTIAEEPDVLKIDVEGAEYAVLQGAKETLLRKRPLILMEVHSIVNMFNVLSFLNALSYEIELIRKESHGICYIEARPKPI